MYSPAKIAGKYLRYYFSASNGHGHGIHSPFVFEFVQKILNDDHSYSEYQPIEQLRKKLLGDLTPVPIIDFGAGSTDASLTRSIKYIASHSAKSSKYAQLLFRIVRYYQPEYILELGTSLGISTAYMASAKTGAHLVTAEGNDVLSHLAAKHFADLHLSNIKVVTGPFDNTLAEILGSLPKLDLVFIDGNHRKEPTLRYFEQVLQKCSAACTIILDDIHWSSDMELAWDTIRQDSRVMLTIDLFFFGIVFFRPEFKVKQHFTIRF